MAPHIQPLKILLITNDPSAAEKICAVLAARGVESFEVQWVRKLSEGLQLLKEHGIAAVLLEFSLPDGLGVERFDKLFTVAPEVPILILTGNDDEALAIRGKRTRCGHP